MDKHNQKIQNVLVTGGGGFLGGAIVSRLVGRGDRVRSFSRKFYPELASLGVEQIQGDISDQRSVEQAHEGIDLVFHTAAKPGIWGPYSEYFKTNVFGTQNVLDACRRHGISRLVHTSSPSVVFNGKNMEGVNESVPYPEKFHAHYPKTKAIAEQHVVRAAKEGWLKAVILRPHLIWGPKDNHLVPRILAKAKRLLRVGDGKNLADTVYIANAADAHILAADKLLECPEISGRIYFITQGEPMPLWDMIDAILKAGGHSPVKRSVSEKTAKKIGAVCEFIYGILHITAEPPMTRFLAEELAASHWFDIQAARKDLGYVPRVSTEEGLRQLEAWLNCKNLTTF